MTQPKTTTTQSGEVWMILKDPKQLAKIMAIEKVSQRKLAQTIGWGSHSYLGRLLRGEVRTLDPDAALKMSIALGVTVDSLFVPRSTTVRGPINHQQETPAA